jgi:hypothetical protein
MNGTSKAGDVGGIKRRNSTSDIPAQVANVVINQLQQGFKEMAVKDDGSGTRTKQDSEQQTQNGLSGHGTGSREDKKEEFRIFSATIAPKIDAVTPQGVADLDLSNIEDTLRASHETQENRFTALLNEAFEVSTPTFTQRAAGYTKEGLIVWNLGKIYTECPVQDLPQCLEAFGQLMAKKAPSHPSVFHTFFHKNLGLLHRESMLSRFSNGFTHRVETNLSKQTTTILSATQLKQAISTTLADANILSSLGATLENLANSISGDIANTDPKIALITDIAEILMSETNRGALSDSNSGISRLLSALAKEPKLCVAIQSSPIATHIVCEFEKELAHYLVPINISAIGDPFLKALTIAVTTDHITGTDIQLSKLCSQIICEDDVDFSGANSRENLDVQKENTPLAKLITEGKSFTRVISEVPVDRRARIELKTYLLVNASELQNNIDKAYDDKLDELRTAFTAKLTEGITLPTTADRTAWESAANSLHELNASFLDLYRPEEEDCNDRKATLTALAKTVMARYSVVAGAGLPTATQPPIAGTHDAQLATITARLDQHTAHQTAFREIFANAPANSPMQAAMGPINSDIQRPIDALLTRKLEVANAKLTTSTDDLKGALKALYKALGKDEATAHADAETEANRRKATASATILTDDDKNTQATTTSAAADGLDRQSRDIENLARAYTSAKEQINGVIANTRSDIATSNASTITEAALTEKEDALDRALTAAISRFTTSGSSDPAVAGINTTLERNKADARSTGIGAIRDFAASGIKVRQAGESAAQRLTYLQTEDTRLRRFLPETTKTEKDTLTASENLRIANEATAAARAAASAAALAKAELLADISTRKRDMDTLRASLDTLRDRRLDTDATGEKATTNRTGTEFTNLHPLDATSTESGIATYQSKMATYKTAITAEIAALKACEAADIRKLDTVKRRHADTVSAYQREVDATRTESAEVTRLSALLATEGATPKASTIADVSAALTADTLALGTARNDKTRELATANTQFETAKSGMTTALSEFYTATGVTENAATKADTKAQTARTTATIDGDPHIAIQTTRTHNATANLTAEVRQIQTLTRLYSAAIKALAAADSTTQTPTALNDKTATLLSDFDRNTARMPAAEKAIARDRLVGEIATKTTYKTQLDALTRANTDITAELARLSTGSIDGFHIALGQGLERLNALQRNLIQDGHTAKTTAQTLRDTITATLAISTPLMANRPTAEKLPALRRWNNACGTLSGTLTTSTVPQAWRAPLTAEITTQSSRLNAREDRLTAVTAELNTAKGTLKNVLMAGGMSESDATTQATTTLTTACLFDPTTEDELDGANRAVGLMASAIDMSRENNAMAVARLRLETVTAEIRKAYAPGKTLRDLDTIMANLLQQADRETAQTLRGTDPTPSLKTNQKAEILEAKLQALTDAAAAKAVKEADKKAIDAAFQQIKTLRGELKGTLSLQKSTAAEATEKRDYEEAVRAATAACDGATVKKPSLAFLQHIANSLTATIVSTRTEILSDASTALRTERDAWQTASGIEVATIATIEARLLNGRTKEDLSVIELGTFLNDMKLQTAAYADIASAAKAYNTEQAIEPGNAFIQSEATMAIYGKDTPSKKERAQTVSAERLHTAADTLRSRIAEIKKAKEAEAAAKAKETAIQALKQKRVALEKQLTQVPDTMKARVALLQSVFSKLATIKEETEALFLEDTQQAAQQAKYELTSLTKKVKAKYSDYLSIDTSRIRGTSTASLTDIRTASSGQLARVSTGIQDTHNKEAKAFKDAYNIKGSDNRGRLAAVSELSAFDADYTGAVTTRRAQFATIQNEYRKAAMTLSAAYETAKKDVNFSVVTAAQITAKTDAFAAACVTAKEAMERTLQNIPPDTDQPGLTQLGSAITNNQTQLKNYFIVRVSSAVNGPSQDLSRLTPTVSDRTSIQDLRDHTNTALSLQSRAEDLREFLNPGLLDTVSGITTAHLAKVISVAESVADTAIQTAKSSALRVNAATITSAELATCIRTLNDSMTAAVNVFTDKTQNMPRATTQSKQDKFRGLRVDIPLEVEGTLKTRVSAPLETTRATIAALLAAPGTTLAQLIAQDATVTQLKARRAELGQPGNNWLTDGLAAQIDATVAAYEAKVAALETRAGQITALTGALDGLTFDITADTTFAGKWTMIQANDATQIAWQENDDFRGFFDENPRDRTITQALADLETRRNTAIANHAPERQALIAGLAGQLDDLATAGFDWDATLATAETTAKNTLPAEMRANAEAALTAAKNSVRGLDYVVSTRVAVREALTTATASLTGWPASQESLDNIQAEVTAARAAFTNKRGTDHFVAWDTATDLKITALETSLADKISARDTLIASFQAIIDATVRADTLANRWADIAAKETTLATLQTTAANVPMLVDPQVAAKIAAVQAALDGYNTPTDLERSAVYECINDNLINAAHTRWRDALGSVQDTILNTQTSPRFHSAIRKAMVPMRQDPIKSAIQARIDYKKTIATAAAVLANVKDRTATTLALQEAIEKIKVAPDRDAPAIVDPGDGTNIFATADAAMATQKADIDAGLATHTALVAAFTAAIADATLQLPDMTTTPLITAQAKWVALNTAKTTYNTAYDNADYLFAPGFLVETHPDIEQVDSEFNTEWRNRIANIAPEAATIRQSAATSLAAFVASGSTDPEPEFETLRDGILDGLNIPIRFRSSMKTALDGLGIQAEIQGRVDLHAELQDIETNPTRLSSNPRDTLEMLTQMFGALAANPAYAACDSILAKRLQQLKVAGYGAAAEITAQQRLAGSANIFRALETAEKGTTSQVLKLGSLSNQIELAFRNPTHGPKWKYNVGLDTVLDDILSTNAPPENTDAFIDGLEVALTRLNLQAGGSGIPDPYKRMAESAIERLKTRNDGTPKLCAWVLSANISLVLSILESFGDTRIATVENPLTGTESSLALHEGITLKKEDVTSLTGRTREHGELWYAMYGIPSEATPIAVKDIDAYNIPGQGIDETSFCTLIHNMSRTAGNFVSIADGYTAGDSYQEATLTQTAWLSFCTAMGANGDIASFLESLWPSEPDATISIRALHARWKELLENETNYKHLRYLFGRTFERVYQELVIENPPT